MQRLTPLGALAYAHRATRLPGSSTACVMRLDRAARQLLAANLVCTAEKCRVCLEATFRLQGKARIRVQWLILQHISLFEQINQRSCIAG